MEAESHECELLDEAMADCKSELMHQVDTPRNDTDDTWMHAVSRAKNDDGSTQIEQRAEAQQLQFFDPFEAAVAAAIAPPREGEREHIADWLLQS